MISGPVNKSGCVISIIHIELNDVLKALYMMGKKVYTPKPQYSEREKKREDVSKSIFRLPLIRMNQS